MENDGRLIVDDCIKIVEESAFQNDPVLVIIIMDYEMPIINGAQAIKEISALYNYMSNKLTQER